MSRNDSLISIIVPVYNVEQYLSRCVDSLVNQTYHNIEIILVDDGSPDRSGEICDEYAKKDKRVKVIHQSNGGLSDARNTALDIAKGDYLIGLKKKRVKFSIVWLLIIKQILLYSA